MKKQSKRTPAQVAATQRNTAYGMICMMRGSTLHLLGKLYDALTPVERARLGAISLNLSDLINHWKEK
ncbi:MAG: hypothetical protein WC455_21380 [Dehalococcoidia bacterium]|jgi:hypothetical protein